MKTPVKFGSFLVRMVLFVLIPLTILMVVVVLISQSIHHAAMQQLVGERNLRAAQAAATSIENELLRSRERLEQPLISNSNTAEQPIQSDFAYGSFQVTCSPQKVEVLSDPQSSEFISEDVLLDKLCEINSVEEPLLNYWISESHFTQVLWLITASPTGHLIAGIDLNQMLDQLLAMPLGQNHLAILVYDQNHELIYETGERLPGGHDLYHASILSGLHGTSGVMLPDKGHSSHVVAYTPIQSADWILVMDEAWEDISNPSLSISQWLPLLLIPMVVIFIFLLLLGYRQIVRPLNQLALEAHNLGSGDENALRQEVGGVDEILSLQSVLQEMSGELIQSRKNLAGYASDLTQAIEAEKKELARELHDDSLQDLIVIKQSAAAEQSLQPHILKTQIQDVIQKLRGVIRGLRPPYLDDLGLVTAIQVFAEEKSLAGVEVKVEVEGDETRLPGQVELVCFRITQEAITNAIKHAKPNLILVKLHFLETIVKLEITDDGSGFEVPDRLDQLAAQSRFGLLGMQERAEKAGCRLTIKSKLGKGTTVLLDYPIDPLNG